MIETNSLKHIIYNIRTLIKDVHSDDLKFTDRNIAYWIKYLRSKLIRQDYEKNRSVSDNVIQELSVELELIDSGNSIGLETGDYIIKSKSKLPKFISTYKKDLLLNISSQIDDTFVVTIQPKSKSIRNKYNKYGKKYPTAYLENGYLYLKGCNFYIENILITGVFEDPLEVESINNPSLSEDDLYDLDYPIEGHMIDMINSIIKSNELNLYFQIPEDKVNDAQTNSL